MVDYIERLLELKESTYGSEELVKFLKNSGN
jgi:hypothetical protein